VLSIMSARIVLNLKTVDPIAEGPTLAVPLSGARNKHLSQEPNRHSRVSEEFEGWRRLKMEDYSPRSLP
jgi:hypothetical protein